MNPFAILVAIVVVFIGGMFLYVIVAITRGIADSARQRRYDDQQPLLSRDARVVGKRLSTAGVHGMQGSTRTSYFVTFEIRDTGERLELPVSGIEYGGLAEGDGGSLRTQGSRYHGFTRALA